jgi:hypothetical protein
VREAHSPQSVGDYLKYIHPYLALCCYNPPISSLRQLREAGRNYHLGFLRKLKGIKRVIHRAVQRTVSPKNDLSEERSLRGTVPAQFTQPRPISAYMHNAPLIYIKSPSYYSYTLCTHTQCSHSSSPIVNVCYQPQHPPFVMK